MMPPTWWHQNGGGCGVIALCNGESERKGDEEVTTEKIGKGICGLKV